MADLKIIVLNLLVVCWRYETVSLWNKVDFLMTDSTSHNMEVETIVSEKLNTDHLPDHLLCEVHPSLMFNRVFCDFWKDVDRTYG